MAKFKRFLAMALVLFVFASALPMQTLAAEPIHTTEPSPEGLVTDVYTTTETNTDENGNTVITVTIEKNTEGVIEEDGKEVTLDRDESVVHTQTEKANGSTSEKTTVEGTETKEWVEEDLGDEPGQPEVVTPIIPGEQTQGVGGVEKSDPVTNPDGSVTTTTTTDRTVNVNTSKAEVTVNDSDTGLVADKDVVVNGPAPEYDETDEITLRSDGRISDTSGKDGVFDRNYLSTEKEGTDRVIIGDIVLWINQSSRKVTKIFVPEGTELPEDFEYEVGTNVQNWYKKSNGKLGDNVIESNLPEGYKAVNNADLGDIDNWYVDGNLVLDIPDDAEFRYIGTGEHSKYFVGFMSVVYKKDPETGEVLCDEDGNPIIDKLLNSAGGDITIDGEAADALLPAYEYDGYSGSRAQNFMLMDANGNRVFAYCCDLETGANTGTWYKVLNLEESDYYASEESEAHIRSIAMNGYWGTSDVAKEDGSYEMGSLESIKEKLKAAIENGELSATVLVPQRKVNDNGDVVIGEDGKPIYTEMNILEYLDGLTAGEAMLATQAAIWTYANGSTNVANGKDGTIVVSPDWYRNHQIGYSKNESEPLDDAAGARVELLYQWLINLETEEDSTIVINEANFVEDISLVVGDKVEGDENNKDDNKDNDVYNTALNFTLAFVPGEKDEMYVCLMDGNNQPILGEDGEPIKKLLAAEDSEKTGEDVLKPVDGVYTLSGMKLSENSEFEFDLRLEGTQYLEKGVYVYQSVNGRKDSQSFVGVAEGERNVDVSIGVTISFDVDENNHVVAERKWSYEEDPEIEPQDPPVIFRLDLDETEEIPEEPVPLAAPVTTGDNSFPWMLIVMMAIFGMAVVNVIGKKKAA